MTPPPPFGIPLESTWNRNMVIIKPGGFEILNFPEPMLASEFKLSMNEPAQFDPLQVNQLLPKVIFHSNLCEWSMLGKVRPSVGTLELCVRDQRDGL